MKQSEGCRIRCSHLIAECIATLALLSFEYPEGTREGNAIRAAKGQLDGLLPDEKKEVINVFKDFSKDPF